MPRIRLASFNRKRLQQSPPADNDNDDADDDNPNYSIRNYYHNNNTNNNNDNPPFRYYLKTLQCAFPDDDFTTHTGFELRHITLDPGPPVPSLTIVLVQNANSAAVSTIVEEVCDRFAQDFDFFHLHIPTYLGYLNTLCPDGKPPLPRELGLLHPRTLRLWLAEGRAMDAYFLLRILRIKIDEEVGRGRRSVLVSGFEEGDCVVEGFARDIAEPMASINFTPAGEAETEASGSFAKHTVHVPREPGEDTEAIYDRLLAALGSKAGLEQQEVG